MENNTSENKGYYSEPQPQSGMEGNNKNNNSSRILGIVIVVMGLIMLLRATDIMNYPILKHVISIPTGLVILGLAMGHRNNYQIGAWVFLTGAGVFFLLKKFDLGIERYTLPIVLIGIGLFVLSRSKRNVGFNTNIPNLDHPTHYTNLEQPHIVSDTAGYHSQEEYVRIDSVFSTNDRTVLSSNFKGGKIGTIFGGVKLDCKSAHIQQDIVIDVYSIFGGIELIFPANWIVINETTTIFGAVEDKRRLVNRTGTERRVILTGFTLFGGIEIKNI